MALTRRKRYKNATMRRSKIGPSTSAQSPPRPNVVPTSLVHDTPAIDVLFPVPMIYSGVLPGWHNNGNHVIGVTVNSPVSFTLTFSGATTASAVSIPFEDPSFRSAMGGGYVQAGSILAT